MKKTNKKIISIIGSVIGITGVSLIGLTSCGTKSTPTETIEIKKENFRNFAFNSFEANMIDNTGSLDKVVGVYNRVTDTVTPVSSDDSVPVDKFIKDYKLNHHYHPPLFKIKTKLFNFDNRYLAAVSPKDWYDYVVWFAGGTDINGNTVKGRLSFGPDAGALTTFEIVAGMSGDASTIAFGERENAKREFARISFYPDGFFGSIKLYNENSIQFHNRLLTTSLNPYDPKVPNFLNGKNSNLVTLDEVRTYLEVINKINKHNHENQDLISASSHKINLNNHAERTTVGQLFGEKWGTHSIHEFKPYYLEKAKVRINANGEEEQLYKIYSELVPWIKDDDTNPNNNLSLLETVTKNFPELLTHVNNGVHFERLEDGSFDLKETGAFDTMLPSDQIGFPLLLSSVKKDFKGMGIDFLKYVGLHEYGHQLTLMMAQDDSEGGVVVGNVHAQRNINIESLYNLTTLNSYLAARAPHLRAFTVDVYGRELKPNDNSEVKWVIYKVCSEIWNKNTCTGTITPITLEKITGVRNAIGQIIEPTNWPTYKNGVLVHSNMYGYIGFKNSIEELNAALPHIAPGLTTSEAFILNSFDQISGALNPGIRSHFLSTFGSPHYPLFNNVTKKWDTVNNLIKLLKDSNDHFIFSQSKNSPDRPLPGTEEEYLDLTKFFAPNIIFDEPFLKYSDEYLTVEKRANIQKSINEYISSFLIVDRIWNEAGKSPEENIYDKNHAGPKPQNLLNPRPGYLYSYAEVMTRDFVQMIWAYDDIETPLANGPEGLNIYQSESSMEYYLSKSLTQEFAINIYNEDTWKNFFTSKAAQVAIGKLFDPQTTPSDTASNWKNPVLLTKEEKSDFSTEALELYNSLLVSAGENQVGLIFDNNLNNGFVGGTLLVSQGFENDRHLREALNASNTDPNMKWGLYQGTEPNNGIGAHEYWKFIKDSYGVGDRAISGLFKETQSNKLYVYGYISTTDANNVKWLTFKNKETGEITSVEVHSGDEVSNLFYLETQADIDSIHTVEDDGYTGWSTDKFQPLSDGKYEVYFSDSNNQKIESSVSFLGNRNYIAENGKFFSVASSYFTVDPDGSAVYIVGKK